MPKMSKTGLLIISLPEKINRITNIVKEHFIKTLYVQLSHQRNEPRLTENTSKNIIDIYKCTSQLFPNIDVRVILNELRSSKLKGNPIEIKRTVDIVILDPKFSNEDVSMLIKAKFKGSNNNMSIVMMEPGETELVVGKREDKELKVYEHVVLGGTFDRLHSGHKILLSEALLRCTRKLTVGVTDTCMLKSKKLWELIEPCQERIEKVKDFLKDVDCNIEYSVVPIQDPFGPTKEDPEMDMIVVSAETYRGGLKVNEIREKNGLKPLHIHSVDLVTTEDKLEEEEDKISSSNTRMRMLGTRLRKPQANNKIPEKPYLIGLTGGIASGKSAIGKRLQKLGAGLIDCDKIAHQLYEPGTKVYYELIEIFGKEIIAEDGLINRKVLGGIVFNDKSKLEILNQLLWPAILEKALEQSQKLYEDEKKDIVVIEAAVLLRAGWHEYVHEVWTSIIPEAEAVRRIMERNKLTEDESKARLSSQPTNLEQIEIANVVFSSLWSYEYTQKQVEKGWKIVQEELGLDSSSKL